MPTLADLGANAPAEGAGQLWVADEIGGYMYSDNLSDKLRILVQARCRYRQFCELPEPTMSGTGKGAMFHWNVYGDVETQGRALLETERMPSTRLQAKQGTLTVTEYGNSVPYSGKLDDLSAHPVYEIIKKAMERDAAQTFDYDAYLQFRKTPLKVVPQGGNSATAITITENGTPAAANGAALTTDHVKEIALQMRERNIPTHSHGDYYCIARPTTYRVVEKNLENIQQYTADGFQMIRNGEKGRHAGVRFVEQTNVAASGDFTGNNGDEAFFFGDDVVVEGCVLPEEIRGKIPDDYGRGKGVAWYALLGFAPARLDAADARCVHWTSV